MGGALASSETTEKKKPAPPPNLRWMQVSRLTVVMVMPTPLVPKFSQQPPKPTAQCVLAVSTGGGTHNTFTTGSPFSGK